MTPPPPPPQEGQSDAVVINNQTSERPGEVCMTGTHQRLLQIESHTLLIQHFLIGPLAHIINYRTVYINKTFKLTG